MGSPADAGHKKKAENFASDMDHQDTQTGNQSPFCVECRDQEASIFCEQCDEDFCEVCHNMLHRTGNRRKHTAKNLKVEKESTKNNGLPEIDMATIARTPNEENHTKGPAAAALAELDGTIINSGSGATFGEWMTKRAKYVPLRLDEQERGKLRLLEAGLNVSEYTDKIDIISYQNKAKRIVNQIRDLCATISGLLVSGDYKIGAQQFSGKSIKENEKFFQQVFEVGRRHKIMNPEKMRSSYGKLMYILMDSVIPEVEELLGFTCVIPINTVHSFLAERGCIDLLHDDDIALATREISPECKTRAQIQAEVQRKESASQRLSEKYANEQISAKDIDRCLKSLSDNHAFLKANRDPCEKMLKYLSKYFKCERSKDDNYSLAITAGRNGHRLTHSHSTQYAYVQQSLSLWREIVHEMFKLWSLADEDLISSNPYRLTNTGQGLQRIQACSNLSRPMHMILQNTQKKCDSWVGSSVIHLGDKNVPNAFMFIDKYNQVSRILTPLVNTLDKLDSLTDDPMLEKYIEKEFGGVECCRKEILYDFFRCGFDGSGADNYFDAGSCIDGRLTSAWNWCSKIEKKRFFPIFLLTGFVGFDGSDW